MNIPLMDMITRSGMMGRVIILLLLIFSLVSWAIIFNRLVVLGRLSSGNRLFRKKFAGLRRLSEIENLSLSDLNSPMAQLGRSGAIEYRRILEDARSHTAVKDWSFFLQNQFTMARDYLESSFNSIVAPFDKGVFLLAMISSIAPFLGLLGTVWGIMNSFYEIGTHGSASLPVVAPGIAEALITTIVGLAVAIPSLFFYNYINHRTERIEDDLDEFKETLTVRLKREIFNLLYSGKPTRQTPPSQSNNYGP
ncbi:MotA/TolQ/ExbB proton channel family protein [Chitinispirillales bacterium ANBcel5]|uniref:MotA/TolQ/ExbB proton channel family protein n=1 Tax=Cellulosispirillum alkaliphilum TaxID=3039283 RepID=UPI002A58C7CA|nr:MotA/TolQ/ExbB proton channel family protein [Chitinispirillales bacterium ANBcel5]